MIIPKDDLFFDLLRSGLWDKAGTVADYSSVDWKALIRLAREQTVVGLISDGVPRRSVTAPNFRCPLRMLGS